MPILLAKDPDTLRRRVYWILIAISAAIMIGRIVTIRSNRGGTPMTSANDRSRWCTIRALGDEGTYAIDNVIMNSQGKRNPEWYTIDMVRHRAADGHEHYYSSKPTLFSTLLVAPYWLIKTVTGMTLSSHPFQVMQTMLILINVLPMVGFLILVTRFAEQFGQSNWSKWFVVCAAAFATPLTTFAVTLNNHVPAAIGVLVAVWATVGICHSGWQQSWVYFLAGAASAWAATCDLPALSFFVFVAAALFLTSPGKTSWVFAPPAFVIFAAAIGTNYLAHGTWSTPYAHRRDGPLITTIPMAQPSTLKTGKLDDALREQLAEQGMSLSSEARLSNRTTQPGYMIFDPQGEHRYAVNTFGEDLQIRQWDNWYEYEGTYWTPENKRGVDRGEPSKWTYAFHSLIGHHGVISLTPIWLLSVVGIALWLMQGDKIRIGLAISTLVLTVVCLTFYIVLRPVEDRNYGGVSCCFRWTVWLIPLWLVCLIPAADVVVRRPWLRMVGGSMLLVSVFSAFYNNNPWSHPWLFDVLTRAGWIGY